MAMAEILDRRAYKTRADMLLRGAQVPARPMTALFMGIVSGLTLLEYFGSRMNLFSTFLSILVALLTVVLEAGFILYCMAVRRREYAPYVTLFDGFAHALKLIALTIVTTALIFLWLMLFVIPGIVAAYRYRFAVYNLLENPELGIMEAIGMSKRQTYGYKWQLFMLDMSYLGWAILGSLPALYYRHIISLRVQAALLGAETYEQFFYAYSNISGTVLGISAFYWQILIALWGLFVSLFYLARYKCVELDYFDAAKRSSGVGIFPADPYGGGSGNGFGGYDGGFGGYNGGSGNGFGGTDDYNGSDTTSGGGYDGPDDYDGGSGYHSGGDGYV